MYIEYDRVKCFLTVYLPIIVLNGKDVRLEEGDSDGDGGKADGGKTDGPGRIWL